MLIPLTNDFADFFEKKPKRKVLVMDADTNTMCMNAAITLAIDDCVSLMIHSNTSTPALVRVLNQYPQVQVRFGSSRHLWQKRDLVITATNVQNHYSYL